MFNKFAVDITRPFNLAGLDGLRAIAILLVLFHHAWEYTGVSQFGKSVTSILKLGWVGVDIFFVLSGFLICAVLLQARGQQKFFSTFYFRRMFRIFPLYYACLAILGLAAVLILVSNRPLPPALSDVDKIWVNVFYLTNIFMAFQGFDWAFFRPTWTLALEEQFYLIFPLLVFFLAPKKLFLTLAGIVVASPMIRLFALEITGSQDFVALFPLCRFDGFAAGALCALIVHNKTEIRTPYLLPTMLLSGFGAAFLLLFAYRSDLTFIAFGYTSIYVFFAGLIYIMCKFNPKSWSFLSAKPMTMVGHLSYSLYLLHMLVRGGLDGLIKWDLTSIPIVILRMLAIVMVSLAVAHLSFRYFEQPIRIKGYRWIKSKSVQTK